MSIGMSLYLILNFYSRISYPLEVISGLSLNVGMLLRSIAKCCYWLFAVSAIAFSIGVYVSIYLSPYSSVKSFESTLC